MSSLKPRWPIISTSPRNPGAPGFSLVELLVACAVLTLLLTVLFTVVSQALRLWQQTEGQKTRRESARICMEMMVRDLEASSFPISSSGTFQFLLNPPALASCQNRDAIFWQAITYSDSPPGVPSEVGYFVQWEGTKSALCRYRVPASDADSIFHNPADWLSPAKVKAHAPGLADSDAFAGMIAENVIGLWITLYDRNGNEKGLNPTYDSRVTDSRPAVVEIGLALIDARIASRITSPEVITSAYTAAIDDFPSRLPLPLREGVQIFKFRVLLKSRPLQ